MDPIIPASFRQKKKASFHEKGKHRHCLISQLRDSPLLTNTCHLLQRKITYTVLRDKGGIHVPTKVQRLNTLSNCLAQASSSKPLLHQIFNSILPKYRNTERKPLNFTELLGQGWTSVHSISSNVPQILEAVLNKDRVLCSLGCPETHSVDPAGLELMRFACLCLPNAWIKAFATTAGLKSIFKFKNYLNATLKIQNITNTNKY